MLGCDVEFVPMNAIAQINCSCLVNTLIENFSLWLRLAAQREYQLALTTVTVPTVTPGELDELD